MQFPFQQGLKIDRSWSYFAKKCTFEVLKLNFQDEGHLHANSLFFVLPIYHICLLFWFLGCGIRMNIPILTGVQKGHISGWWIGQNLLKNVLLQTNFQCEARLYANCLLYILNFCFKYLFLQLLSSGIRTQLPILTGLQNGWISSLVNGQVCYECTFEVKFLSARLLGCQLLLLYSRF